MKETFWYSYTKSIFTCHSKSSLCSGQELPHIVSPMPTTWKIRSQYLLNERMIFSYGLVCLLSSWSSLCPPLLRKNIHYFERGLNRISYLWLFFSQVI